jgi:hypothetical protein
MVFGLPYGVTEAEDRVKARMLQLPGALFSDRGRGNSGIA